MDGNARRTLRYRCCQVATAMAWTFVMFAIVGCSSETPRPKSVPHIIVDSNVIVVLPIDKSVVAEWGTTELWIPTDAEAISAAAFARKYLENSQVLAQFDPGSSLIQIRGFVQDNRRKLVCTFISDGEIRSLLCDQPHRSDILYTLLSQHHTPTDVDGVVHVRFDFESRAIDGTQ